MFSCLLRRCLWFTMLFTFSSALSAWAIDCRNVPNAAYGANWGASTYWRLSDGKVRWLTNSSVSTQCIQPHAFYEYLGRTPDEYPQAAWTSSSPLCSNCGGCDYWGYRYSAQFYPTPLACDSCSDGIQNQGETGKDCGGPCAPCAPICTDADGDGYKVEGGACGTQDCNDNNKAIFPGAPEICDGKDNNCNDQTDEGGVCDADGDGVPDATDQCPGTKSGVIVDAVGCPLCTDADGDGQSREGGQCGPQDCNDSNALVSTETAKGCVDKNESCPRLPLGSNAHAATGELDDSLPLFTVSGAGPALGLSLYYNSQDAFTGSLGLSWSHSHEFALKELPRGDVRLRLPNGKYLLYTKSGAGYLSQPGDYAVLTKNSDGTFLLTQKAGTRFEFGANSRITRIVDRNGNALTFAYSGDDLASVADGTGRTITFNHANGKLTSVADPAGTVYTLNVGTTLDRITLPDSSSWQFGYQDNAFLTSKIDPSGNLTTYRYDEQLRVTGSTDPEERSRSIDYPEGEDTVRTTIFTEKDGSIWRYTYDVASGDLVSKTDPAENTVSYSYDADHNLTAKTEPGVGTSYYAYDGAGNLIESTDAAGNTTEYTYNAYGQVTSVTDAADATTTYEYDERGNLLNVSTPDEGGAAYEYDAQGRLTSIVTATGETTTLTYDAQGNVSSITGPDKKPTTFSYDANGRRTASIDADGNTTRFEYDGSGRLIKVIDARENVTRYEYDANGNRIRVIDANNRTTSFDYNFAGQMVSMTDALDHTTTFVYGGSAGCSSCGGGVDKLTALIDAKKQATLFKYDPLGRLIKETDPLGHFTEYSYDAAGRVTSKTDPNRNTILYDYDTLGRLIAKNYPDGTQTTFSYDAKGNLLTAANASIAYTFTYDGSNRLTTVADSFGHQLDYTYDAAGKRTQMTSGSGIDIDYAYDDAGRLEQIDSPAGNFIFGYDTLGRRSRLAFPNGVTTTYTYDALGRLIDMVSAKGSSLIAENHYTHDKVGNRLSNRDARSTMSYGYDAIYRLTEALSNAPGYSANTAAKGKGKNNTTQNQKEIYVYDPVGNRLKTDKVRNYAHNADNELLNADGTRYSYDANGNRTSKTTAAGITTYDWDAENRLTQVKLPDGKTVTFAYDPFGRRIAKTADGITTRYTYDSEDILFETENGSIGNVYIHGPGIDEPLALLDSKGPAYYHADGLGSIVAMTDANAKVGQNYEYDSFGNRKDMQNSIKQPYTYTSREYDRETGLYYYRARYYDAMEGRFISKDPVSFLGGSTNLFLYALNNPTNYVDPSGLITLPEVWVKIEKKIAPFAVGGSAIVVGNVVTYTGLFTVGASFVMAPETGGASLIAFPAGVTTAASGVLISSFGTTVIMNHINDITGLNIPTLSTTTRVFPEYPPNTNKNHSDKDCE
ncbi:MAG: hypothetical protein FIB02_04230 [Desulfuromonas sp.]|nr:hypothetical protein [Desulfuromonas sp.]